MILKTKCLLFIVLCFHWEAQTQEDSIDSNKYIIVAAGAEYDRSRAHEWLLGKNRRDEWSTPIQVPIVMLDTIHGGLKPYEKSGGGESKSLRLKSANGREYALRSINKSRIATLPMLFKTTFLGSIAQDAVSMSHPYAAFAVPMLLEEGGIPHARPQLVYLPRQPALDSFNAVYGNTLFLLEERPAGDWRTAAHLGRFKEFLDTEEVKEKLLRSNRYGSNQQAFIKARLVDLMISDVDRHGGNWKWGVADTGTMRFHPVPLDRDQAFFTHDGLLTGLSIAVIRRRVLETFGFKIKNIKTLTTHDGMLDKFFANEMNGDHWHQAALSLQQALTDEIIIQSVRQMPAEVVAISGAEIIGKLKARRDDLVSYANRYYKTLAKKVEVNGTVDNEHFIVKKLNGRTLSVSVYRSDEQKGREPQPYYHRVFSTKETKKITLYGSGGNDVFQIDPGIKGIKIKTERAINEDQHEPFES